MSSLTKVVKSHYIQLGQAAEVYYPECDIYPQAESGFKTETDAVSATVTANREESPAETSEAETMIENARAQAEDILSNTRRQAQDLLEEARKQGYEEGKKRAFEFAHLEIGEAVSEISALLHSLEEQKAGMLRNYEGKIRDLAIHIAKKVIQTELDNNNETFLNIYRSAVQELRDQEWIRLSVSDLQVQFATENADTLMSLAKGAKHIEIVGLPEAPSGTCIVETPDGIVDASLDTQMDKIKEAFADVELFLESQPEDKGPFAE